MLPQIHNTPSTGRSFFGQSRSQELTVTGTNSIDIGVMFSRFPAGRVRSDGPFSGERFREEYLIPAIDAGGKISVNLDSALGFGSSFLEEAFGGIVRDSILSADEFIERLEFESRDRSLVDEIKEYINAARR